MFCINCGKKIPDDAIFCKYCGYCVSPQETSTNEVSTNEVKKSHNPNIVIASIISVIVLLLLIKIGMPYFKIIHDGEKITISCNEQEDNTSDTDDIDSYDEKANIEKLCKHDVPIIHRRLEKAGIHNITSQIDGTMTILIGKKDMEDRADDIKQMISDHGSILLISESDAQTAGPEQLIDFSKVSGDNYINDSDIKKAKAIKQKDKNGKTTWSVEVTLDNWGREIFEQITKNNIDKYLNVYVNCVICSSTQVQAVITDGRFLISPAEGMSESEAKMLAAKINYRIEGEYFSFDGNDYQLENDSEVSEYSSVYDEEESDEYTTESSTQISEGLTEENYKDFMTPYLDILTECYGGINGLGYDSIGIPDQYYFGYSSENACLSGEAPVAIYKYDNTDEDECYMINDNGCVSADNLYCPPHQAFCMMTVHYSLSDIKNNLENYISPELADKAVRTWSPTADVEDRQFGTYITYNGALYTNYGFRLDGACDLDDDTIKLKQKVSDSEYIFTVQSENEYEFKVTMRYTSNKWIVTDIVGYSDDYYRDPYLIY